MDVFVAEIRIFPFTFAPQGWAPCEGQLMPITQNTALFSLIGTIYGGDGKSTFALPDLRDRVPMRGEQGPGLSNRLQGESDGQETVTLIESEIPIHSHAFQASGDLATATQPSGRLLAQGDGIGMYGASSQPSTSTAGPEALPPAGGSLPHNNLQPYLTLQFCIALQGIFPARSNPPM